MKVCIFATGLPNVVPSGGKEKRAWELKEYLESKGHKVIYRCPRQSMNYLLGCIYRLWFFVFGDWFVEADVYYVFRCPLFLFMKRERKIGDFGRIWIWHWSPLVLLDNLSSILGWLYCDLRIFNNELYKFGSGIVLNPGVDLSLFKPMQLPELYDFLFVGRNERAKGVDLFYEFAKKYPCKRFLCVGFKGKDLPNVRYVEYVPNVDMPKVYNQCKGLLLLSRGESFGITQVEAAACGVPLYTLRDGFLVRVPFPWRSVRLFDKRKYLAKVCGLITGRW